MARAAGVMREYVVKVRVVASFLRTYQVEAFSDGDAKARVARSLGDFIEDDEIESEEEVDIISAEEND